jgi:phage virion morphogenesis protein
MLEVARALRTSQQGRIRKQQNPDGSAYISRKPRLKNLRSKKGRIKRAAMFAKLRTTQYMQIQSDANGLAIGFAGRVARVARVHQLGELDAVAPNGARYKYPARVLLGFSNEDRATIHDIVLKHLANIPI